MSDSPLRLDAETVRRLAHQAAEIIADYWTAAPAGPAFRPDSLAEAAARIGGPLPLHPADPADVLQAIAQEIAPYGVQTAHPRYFGYIGPSAALSAVLADGIAAALNQNVTTSKPRPTHVQVELTVVDWLRQMLGLPPGAGGLLTSGGTMANLLGLAAARQAKAPADIRRDGVRGLPAPLTVYASQKAHFCHRKSVELLGLGSRYLRLIPTDAHDRMDVEALRHALAADRAEGLCPLAVIATAGTTVSGAVDPVAELADLCAREEIWLHVDACYGGFALLAAQDGGEPALQPETHRHLLAMGRADSVAADPHKFLYTPFEAGSILLRDPRHLQESFRTSSDYIPDAEHSFIDHDFATSRGFRALKIWASLRHHGSLALGRAIAENLRLARRLHALTAAAPDLEPVGPAPELSAVCFRYLPPNLRERLAEADPAGRCEIERYVDRVNERLVADLQECGDAYVSNTSVAGRPVIRACILNYRTTAADVEAFVALVQQLGRAADDRLPAPS